MTGKQFADLIRLRTRTNSTTFTDADVVILANSVKDDLALKIAKDDPSVFNIPMTASMLDNQREYPLPSEVLSNIVDVEAKLDGVNWVQLIPMSLEEYSGTEDEDTIKGKFTNNYGEAGYIIARNSIKIYSGDISAVADGLRIIVNTFPADIATTTLAVTASDMCVDPSTTTFALPRELHNVWADGVVIGWKSSREKPIPLTRSEQLWESKAWEAVYASKHGKIGNIYIAEVPYNDGSQY